MIIDAYTHIFPRPYFERIMELVPNRDAIKRWAELPALYDLDTRFAKMDAGGPDYRQVLTLSMPGIEFFAGPERTPELARLANDGMAELVARHPDRFIGFVASLPLNNPGLCPGEIDRAVGELGARGIQIQTNVLGEPLDRPEMMPIFERMAAHDLPIWLHPIRGANFTDYLAEEKSLYEIWWAFGWPYETSATMARLVFWRLFDKLPGIKIITHHMGGYVPYSEGRIVAGWEQLGSRSPGAGYEALLDELEKPLIDYFHMFYADTATFGSALAMRCGAAFFGPAHCLFGTDFPFDPEGGARFVRDTPAIVRALDLAATDEARILHDNARALLKL